jgi:hypothetical protein
MAEHVHVDRKRQPGGFPGPLDHARDAHALERLATFVNEDVSRLDAVGLLLLPQKLEALEFVAIEVMAAVDAPFQPTHDDGALGQVEIVPAEISYL